MYENQTSLLLCLLLQTYAFHLEFLLVSDYHNVWHFLSDWVVKRVGHAVAYTELQAFLSECTMVSLRHDTQFLISNFVNKYHKTPMKKITS